jgi:hypothetical protein
MSAYAYSLSVLPEMYGAAKPAQMRSKAKIHFAELVRPDGYWPQPYSLEQAFQIYRWMIKTGRPFSGSHRYGVYDLIVGSGALGNADLYYDPIRSIETLRKRFHHAILGRANCQNSAAWREKEKIALGQERVLCFPHYTPFVGSPVLGKILSEAQIKTLMGAYFGAVGKLRIQLNPYHPGAVEIIELVVRVDTHRFQFKFDLHYGYDGSGWWHELAVGEQLIDTLGSALIEFERVSGQSLLDSVGRR